MTQRLSCTVNFSILAGTNYYFLFEFEFQNHFLSKSYRSEGPAQVFLSTIKWLLLAFGSEKREYQKQLIISYDNMCHLNSLKIARKVLPLPG